MRLASQNFNLCINFIINLIIIEMMDQSSVNPIPLINSIVSHLYQHEPIDNNMIDKLTQMQTYEISAYLGLTNLLYNRVLQVANSNNYQQSAKLVQGGYYNDGKILQLRGEILKQYAKFLAPLLPQPAFSLACFDFQSFDKFCNDRGLQQLIRCSRGIYPCIDTHKTLPLQFLPFYEQVKGQGPVIVGNLNWQVARNLFEKKCLNEEKSLAKQQNKVDISKNQEQQQLDIGKRLCYILLMRRKDQMEQYLKQLNDRIASQSSEADEEIRKKRKTVIDRFRFWYFNYNLFIEQGLQYYKNEGKIQNSLSLIQQLNGSNFEETVIYLLKKAIQSKIKYKVESSINEQMQSKIRGPQFGDKFIWLLQYIKNDNFVPPSQQGENNDAKYKNNNKFLFLAYTYTIQQLLNYRDETVQNPTQVFKQLITYSNCEQQPYYRIFFTNQQILDLYETGKLNQFPTRFMYQSVLKPSILKSIFKNNKAKLANNLDKLSYLETAQRLKFIIATPLLAGIQNISTQPQNKIPGELILDYLDRNKSEFKNLLTDSQGKFINENETIKFYTSFINEWRQIYSFFRNFQLQYFNDLLNKYERIKTASNQNKYSANMNEKVAKIDFKLPMNRPQIYYYLIKQFIDNLERQKNYYVAKKQQVQTKENKNKQQLITSYNKLIGYIKTMEKQSFKQMLDELTIVNPQKPNQQHMNQQITQRQQFDDHAWHIYAQVNLLIGELCKKLVIQGSNEGKYQKTTAMMLTKPRGNAEAKRFAHHIEIEDDQSNQNDSEQNMEEQNE